MKREDLVKELVKKTIAKTKGVDYKGIFLNKSLIIHNDSYEYIVGNYTQFGGTFKSLILKHQLPKSLCL